MKFWMVILKPKKIKSVTAPTFPPFICHEVVGLDAMILVFECWVLSQHFHPPLSPPSRGSLFYFFDFYLYLFIIIIIIIYFTILYWICHTSTWICNRCTRVPHPEPPSHLPPHTIPLGHPSAPVPGFLYPTSNLDWRFVSYMILDMF